MKNANALKERCLEVCDQYIGEPFSEGLKYAVCSRIHNELLDAYASGLIKEAPTKVEVLFSSLNGTVTVQHEDKLAAQWIDDVWKGAPAE
ncbi:MAG: hypothetical protein P8Y00_00005 [Deltaproteobacteria bacterium]